MLLSKPRIFRWARGSGVRARCAAKQACPKCVAGCTKCLLHADQACDGPAPLPSDCPSDAECKAGGDNPICSAAPRKFGDPTQFTHTPDVVMQPKQGVIYSLSKRKNAEHGGFSDDGRARRPARFESFVGSEDRQR